MIKSSQPEQTGHQVFIFNLTLLVLFFKRMREYEGERVKKWGGIWEEIGKRDDCYQ